LLGFVGHCPPGPCNFSVTLPPENSPLAPSPRSTARCSWSSSHAPQDASVVERRHALDLHEGLTHRMATRNRIVQSPTSNSAPWVSHPCSMPILPLHSPFNCPSQRSQFEREVTVADRCVGELEVVSRPTPTSDSWVALEIHLDRALRRNGIRAYWSSGTRDSSSLTTIIQSRRTIISSRTWLFQTRQQSAHPGHKFGAFGPGPVKAPATVRAAWHWNFQQSWKPSCER